VEVEPEVMAIDQPPEPNLEDPDWRFPILEWLVEGKHPSDQTEARRITCRAKAFVLIDGELYKGGATGIPKTRAFPKTRVASCYKRYMPAPVVTTPVRERLSERLFDKVSTGPQ
jgi:hypothetical protein